MILLLLDRKSYLQFGLVNSECWELIQDSITRSSLQVFPYKAPIPSMVFVDNNPNPNPAIGTIICVEKPGKTLCSLDIPCVVVHNPSWSNTIGVITPTIEMLRDGTFRFGECRVESGTYLHKEHFRLARSSKTLIETMKQDIITRIKENRDSSPEYYVHKLNKYDIKGSERCYSNMQENLKMGLTLSDHIGLNPTFRFSESVEKLDIVLT